MLRISVIICALNPRPDYFRRLLTSLREQSLSMQEWELVLVDNASDPSLAETWDLSWHPHHLQVRENALGLTLARLRGIAAASGELLIFVDDDNVVARDYLEQALQIRAAHPFLSVFGAGTIDPELELEPHPRLRPFLSRLGLRTVARAVWTNNPRDYSCMPWGLGLCVTRVTATAYVQMVGRLRISHLLDRRGGRLFAGGDDLFSWVAADTGTGFGIFPELRITHLLRASRLQERYLLRLIHDHAYSHGVLRYVLWGDATSGSAVEYTLRVVLNGMRRGVFSMRCRWAAERGAARARRDIASLQLHPVDPPPAGGLTAGSREGSP